MKKINLSILILIISIISLYTTLNNIYAEDINDVVANENIITNDTINSDIIDEDTINNMDIKDINPSNIKLEDKDSYARVYNNLSKKLILPDGYTDTENEFNNLPMETKNILNNMNKLEKIGTILMKKENYQANNTDIKFKSAGSSSGFSRLSKGDILITSDNKSYHVIRHGHAAMLVDGSTIIEAVRSGVRKYKYDWLSRYNNCYASRVYGGKNKFENTNKTWAQTAADWACGKVGTPYKITSDKDTIKTFYCSQLVYRSYLSASKRKIDLSEGAKYIWPMGLYYNSNTYRIAMYEK